MMMNLIITTTSRCNYSALQNISKRFFSLHHQVSGRKRFYKSVDIIQIENASTKDIASSLVFNSSSEVPSVLYGITLDGKTLKTPARNPMIFKNYLLASTIAAEWDAQTDNRHGIQPSTMPFMQLAATAIDNLQFDPLPAQATCLSFLPTDCALFWTKEDVGLYKQQQEKFQPLLNWLNEWLKIELLVAVGMTMRLSHPAGTTRKMKVLIDSLDPYSLACLQCATMECKSVVLALALLLGRIDVEEAKLLSRMEEEYQLDMWGLVEGGHDMDRLNNAGNLSAASTFFNLIHDNDLDTVRILTKRLALV